MEDTPTPGDPNFLSRPAFDVDLKPMYALTEPQYQAIINQLSTLLFAVIERSKYSGEGQLAEQVAHHAHDILCDYDEDMAEKILEAAQPVQHRARRGII